jgi:hypothetical protein
LAESKGLLLDDHCRPDAAAIACFTSVSSCAELKWFGSYFLLHNGLDFCGIPCLAALQYTVLPIAESLRERRQRNPAMRNATDMTAPQHFAKHSAPTIRLSSLPDWLDFAPGTVVSVELV